ncbi:hypothetical protein QJS83_07030 [Bdellovibrio sp. 22V]|uniref:hypothetical protein n=1 Tax=Bdellovibrio sp. 22V TaxID=3044166 RepID=UPI0025427BA2|nr:hypothetical protein [Bdellovibrio sp. 22V]WII73625.1 hypothetical protein QJS83_07030 [Bdellovibrio sp. 22V]
MRLNFSVSILILGFFVLGLSLAPSPMTVERTPQSVAKSPAGIYYLVNGTDGCPAQVEWVTECQGFSLNTLNSSASASLLESQNFCDINRGPKVSREPMESGYKRILSDVSSKENVIRKTNTTVLVDKKHSISLFQEDMVIFDDTGKFLWEHSQNNKGLSCLYSR